MSQRSFFFDSVSGDRRYTSADFAAVLARLATGDGVVYGYGGQLAVTPGTGLTVQVATGAAWVQGRLFEVYGGAETLSLGPSDPTYDRIDRVVVRLDLSTGVRAVQLAVKAGTAAKSPVPPPLQRDATVWELSLAQVRVRAGATGISAGDVTDERGNASVCGYTAPATLQPTGSGLVAQDSAYSSGVSGFTPSTVKAALDSLAGVRLVELGSNSNGSYARWENGLQVCWDRWWAGNTAQLERTTFPFPAAFVSRPVVTTTASTDVPESPSTNLRVAGAEYPSITATSLTLYYSRVSGAEYGGWVQWLAIGRWK